VSRFSGFLVCATLLAVTLACRGTPEADDLPVQVQLRTAPTPPIVGPVRIVVTITDLDGAPVEGARVRLEGTMTHAGMVPVHGTATEEGDGRYVAPEFEFTMGGEWILFTRVELPDGEEAVREHRLQVVGRDVAPGDDDGAG
jgi:hypothetical protein